ncbi:MAG: hypothetical protein PUF48_06735 [Oscillospiraceae bacterium]|nr:hypothetical protein [Oscillospiraceae bacterium]
MEKNDCLEEWLSEAKFLYMDVYDDNFAINFDRITRQELIGKELLEELIEKGLSLEEEELPF